MLQGLATVLLFVLPMVAWGLTLGRIGTPDQPTRLTWSQQAAIAGWMLVAALVGLGASIIADVFVSFLAQAICLGGALCVELVLGAVWIWGRLPQAAVSASHGAMSSSEMSVSTDSRVMDDPSVLKR